MSRGEEKSQRQDSLTNQMHDLMALAVERGMYDAHDWLRENFTLRHFVGAREKAEADLLVWRRNAHHWHERAEEAEEAVGRVITLLCAEAPPWGDAYRKTVADHLMNSLSALPGQHDGNQGLEDWAVPQPEDERRCPYNDPNCSCLKKADAPQSEDEECTGCEECNPRYLEGTHGG